MWASKLKQILPGVRLVAVLSGLLVLVLQLPVCAALTAIPTPPPAPGSYGLEATKTQPPPTTAATIATPGDGSNFSNSPITVGGLCTGDLLVQVYDNGVLAGAINCVGGSYSLQISLFTGTNDLDVIQYDDLQQASPDSNHISVNYNNADFEAFGTLITLTSNYGRRAANPGQTLTWPLLLSGGNGPYAFSIDWGDGSSPQLKSQALGGEVDVSHVYSQSGIYHVTVKVTDTNGVTAYFQGVAIANGTPTNSGSTADHTTKTITVVKWIWWPLLALVLLFPAYWLGRRSELVSLHKKLEHDMERYAGEQSSSQPVEKS